MPTNYILHNNIKACILFFAIGIYYLVSKIYAVTKEGPGTLLDQYGKNFGKLWHNYMITNKPSL